MTYDIQRRAFKKKIFMYYCVKYKYNKIEIIILIMKNVFVHV